MTDAEHEFWQEYVRRLADGFGLRDWDIRVARDEPSGTNADGSMRVWFAQKRGTMRLNREMRLGASPAEREHQRRVVLHELVHCHADPLDDAVLLAFDGEDDGKVGLFRKYHNRAVELFVDGIATAIAPLFPLPGGD